MIKRSSLYKHAHMRARDYIWRVSNQRAFCGFRNRLIIILYIHAHVRGEGNSEMPRVARFISVNGHFHLSRDTARPRDVRARESYTPDFGINDSRSLVRNSAMPIRNENPWNTRRRGTNKLVHVTHVRCCARFDDFKCFFTIFFFTRRCQVLRKCVCGSSISLYNIFRFWQVMRVFPL